MPTADANVCSAALGPKDNYLKMDSNFGRMRARRRDGQWRSFSHQGRLPAGAGRLAIVGQVYLNGVFGFDDFRLEVETTKGHWQAVPVANGDFAATVADSAGGFPNSWRPLFLVPGFSYRMSTEAANSCLEITGAGLVNYRHNSAAGHTVALNGIKLYYETYGQGEPLLLLHGNGQSIAAFNGQIPELARHYQVIAMDIRAQGQSTNGKQTLTYDLFAEDMSALLTALHHPQQVKKRVTMGANRWADTLAVTAATLREVHQGKALTTWLYPINKQARNVRPLMVLLLDYPRLKATDLAGIAVPTLVLAGEHDMIQDAHTRLIARSLPHGQVHVFPGLSHYAPRENPAMFNATVLSFLGPQ